MEILHFLRAAIPLICLIGSAPTFFIFWFPLRLSSLIFFSKEFYRRYDDFLYSMYQQSVLFFFEHWIKTKLFFHGDAKRIFDKKENVLYLSNHQSSVDWIIANMLAVRQGSLGHIRYILKNDLKWIPLYGFYFQEHGCIYVNRHDKKDLERVERGIRQIKSNGLPVWLVIFPEGTRYNPTNNQSAIQRSKIFAEQKGVKPFEHVLYPRSGATVASIHALKDQFDAIYDVTVIYGRTNDKKRLSAPSMAEFFKRSEQEIHIHLERIPIELIPKENNEEISMWLFERFEKKDALLKEFYDSSVSNEKFFDENQVNQLNLSETLPSLLIFVLTTIFLLLSSSGRTIYVLICILGTIFGFVWLQFCRTRR